MNLLEKETERPYHKIAQLFPLMQGEEFEQLKADIAANGLHEAIWLHPDGSILDGRNRHRACIETETKPTFRTWSGEGSLVGFVVSMNLHRRHLTSSQRAAVAVDILPMLEAEAKERKRNAAARARDRRARLADLNKRADAGDADADYKAYQLSKAHTAQANKESKLVYFIEDDDRVKIGSSVDPNSRLKEIRAHRGDASLMGYIPGDHKLEHSLHERWSALRLEGEWFQFTPGLKDEIHALLSVVGTISHNSVRATAEAGELTGANYRYIQDAKTLARTAPDLFEQVKTGDKTIPQAKREVVKRQRKDSPPLPTDKYRILYADPPWKYSNDGIIGESDHYGHVERHYPSMTITELCEMGQAIQDITEPNAVLFLWVTSPLLEVSFKVIKAWGFKYKTSFIWDKVKHNFGYYNSVRHELLLVCTRGSCTPDVNTLHDSVQSIERSDTHSEKPEEFRQIIDSIYSHGRRLELFARKAVEGWGTWGNEPR